MADRNCVQCGSNVVTGHQYVKGENPDGSLDIEVRHYDCLPVSLRDASPFVTAAREAAESGKRDAELQAHLEANVMGVVL
jgi:hypothetical protein